MTPVERFPVRGWIRGQRSSQIYLSVFTEGTSMLSIADSGMIDGVVECCSLTGWHLVTAVTHTEDDTRSTIAGMSNWNQIGVR